MDLNEIFNAYLITSIPFLVIVLILIIGITKIKKCFKENPIQTIIAFITAIPIAVYFSK